MNQSATTQKSWLAIIMISSSVHKQLNIQLLYMRLYSVGYVCFFLVDIYFTQVMARCLLTAQPHRDTWRAARVAFWETSLECVRIPAQVGSEGVVKIRGYQRRDLARDQEELRSSAGTSVEIPIGKRRTSDADGLQMELKPKPRPRLRLPQKAVMIQTRRKNSGIIYRYTEKYWKRIG